MSISTTTLRNSSLKDLVRAVKNLDLPDRETLEMLLDEEFTHTVIKRGKEVTRLRKQNQLLSFAELKKSFRK